MRILLRLPCDAQAMFSLKGEVWRRTVQVLSGDASAEVRVSNMFHKVCEYRNEFEMRGLPRSARPVKNAFRNRRLSQEVRHHCLWCHVSDLRVKGRMCRPRGKDGVRGFNPYFYSSFPWSDRFAIPGQTVRRI